ncbi:hypothetical protein [Allorhizobium undicola]|uniref:hypothetical protein n=1 Tax=Allorhizobium undicola TaxID=78527 RepID=UPI000AD26DE2|nr:hypothetical protein [Allorhizobium undicola]
MSEKTALKEQKLAQPQPAEAGGVIARSQKMAAALSSYARALTFENRSRRNLYRLAGLAPKTRDIVFTWMLRTIIIVTLVLPTLCGLIYYTMIASPGYESEVRFIVRSAVPMLSRDRYAGDSVEPKAKVIQDTAILLNYLESPAIIQDLQKSIDLRKLFGRDDIDFLSRLPDEPKQEELLQYWKRHHTASVNVKSGIVELEVTAFSPNEAQELLKLVLHLCEQQINAISAGMWNDLRQASQNDVDKTTREVTELRGKFRDMQNQTGVFDVGMSAESILSILTNVEAEIAQLQGRRSALIKSVEGNSPQLGDIDRRLASLQEQAKSLREKTAGTGGKAGNLADYSSMFNQVKLDLQMAEGRMQSAISELEKVKLVSALQLVYVDNFTDPTLPDTNKYPRVVMNMFLQTLVLVVVCAAACGVVLLIRKKLD